MTTGDGVEDLDDETGIAAHLRQRFEGPELPDGGFTERWTARAERHRRGRRAALAAAGLAGVGLAGWAAAIAPPPRFPLEGVPPVSVVATLVLSALCGWIWIGTEPGER